MHSLPHIFIHVWKKDGLRLCILFMIAGLGVNANNITIKNSTLSGQNTALKTVQISFDLSWENSWRISTGPKNWDAAWIFVKYRVSKTSGGDGLWRHVKLNATGHFTPAGGTLKAVNEGAFIYRSANGSGTFTANGVKLVWNYGSHVEKGNDDFIEDDDAIEIRVFGMEMVYVPAGAFYVGDGNTKDAFTVTRITSANASLIGSGYPFGYTNGNSQFPNGFNAFYCMKYEISQGQYVDFLNTLSYSDQYYCTSVSPGEPAGTAVMTTFPYSYWSTGPYINANRSSIDIKIPGSADAPAVYSCNLNGNMEFDEDDDGQAVACNYLLFSDLNRYYDWSGLRPMTELEYEKACRGPNTPVTNEFAWGTTSYRGVDSLTDPGTSKEVSFTIGANAAVFNKYNLNNGPMRVGSFATQNSSRQMAGAGYYGILDLTGNVMETVAFVMDHPNYTGIHGDGDISTKILTWPGDEIILGHRCVIFRGGSWGPNPIGISKRGSPLYITSEGRFSTAGGRGVRNAPL